MGLETLASALNEEAVTLEDGAREPVSYAAWILVKNSKEDAVRTQLAYEHLGILKDGQTTL